MNKYEIETAIINELKSFMPTIKNIPFDKGLPLMQKEAWRLADKYDTDGANVINIMLNMNISLNCHLVKKTAWI